MHACVHVCVLVYACMYVYNCEGEGGGCGVGGVYPITLPLTPQDERKLTLVPPTPIISFPLVVIATTSSLEWALTYTPL